MAMLFVGHRLEEIVAISDRVTVMRDGRWVADLVTADVDQHRIVELMVGRELTDIYPAKAATIGDVVLRLSQSRRRGPLLGRQPRRARRRDRRPGGPRRRGTHRSRQGRLRHRQARHRRDRAGRPSGADRIARGRPGARHRLRLGGPPRTEHRRGLLDSRQRHPARHRPGVALRSDPAPRRVRPGGRSVAAHAAQVRELRPAHRQPVRRQPAEGGAGQVAGDQPAVAHPRRAHPGRRHPGQGRGPPHHRRAGAAGSGHPDDLVGHARAAGYLRPDLRHAPGHDHRRVRRRARQPDRHRAGCHRSARLRAGGGCHLRPPTSRSSRPGRSPSWSASARAGGRGGARSSRGARSGCSPRSSRSWCRWGSSTPTWSAPPTSPTSG